MGGLHNRCEAIAGNMGINLRSGDIGMAQKGLHAAQIGPAIDQMGGKGVPQHVGRQLGGIKARFQSQLFQQLVTTPAGQMSFGPARAEKIAIRILGLLRREFQSGSDAERRTSRFPAHDAG